MNLLLAFVRDNTDFRPIPVQENRSALMSELDEERLFMILRGSYRKMNVALGMCLNYDITDTKTRSNIIIFYLLPCRSVFSTAISSESQRDQAVRRIGGVSEINVGIKAIDDAYFIKTSSPEIVSRLATSEPLRGFLSANIDRLELFHIGNGIIEFYKDYFEEGESQESIGRTLDQLHKIAGMVEMIE